MRTTNKTDETIQFLKGFYNALDSDKKKINDDNGNNRTWEPPNWKVVFIDHVI